MKDQYETLSVSAINQTPNNCTRTAESAHIGSSRSCDSTHRELLVLGDETFQFDQSFTNDMQLVVTVLKQRRRNTTQRVSYRLRPVMGKQI